MHVAVECSITLLKGEFNTKCQCVSIMMIATVDIHNEHSPHTRRLVWELIYCTRLCIFEKYCSYQFYSTHTGYNNDTEDPQSMICCDLPTEVTSFSEYAKNKKIKLVAYTSTQYTHTRLIVEVYHHYWREVRSRRQVTTLTTWHSLLWSITSLDSHESSA